MKLMSDIIWIEIFLKMNLIMFVQMFHNIHMNILILFKSKAWTQWRAKSFRGPRQILKINLFTTKMKTILQYNISLSPNTQV